MTTTADADNNNDAESCEEAKAHSFPTAQRKELKLASGRSLAYYTFAEENEQVDGEDDNSGILYLNGFPGSGLEATVGAEHVKTKRLVAMDRPGLGYTDPPRPGDDDDEDPFSTVCNDIWELADHLKWKKFSVVGVSGGGPHALALLASYLNSPDNNKPKVEKVALVGGVCVSAGVEDMMPINQQLFGIVKSYGSSMVSRLKLRLMFDVPHFLLPILPTSMVHGMVKSSNKDLPEVDQNIFQDMPPVVDVFSDVIKSAVRQGSAGVVADAKRCFTANHSFEAVLKSNYDSPNNESTTKTLFPEVHIYQGKLDRNVPLSHAQYMHEELFHKKSKLQTYDELGHVSLVVGEAKTFFEEIEKQ